MLTAPHPLASIPQEQHVLCHVDDTDSKAPWNTPLRTKVNFNAVPVEATLDTGASLSAVRADLICVNDSYPRKTNQWIGPTVSLANNDSCD